MKMNVYCLSTLLFLLVLIRGTSPLSPPRIPTSMSPPQSDCPPLVCPQDCGTELFIDPQNGCLTCRCDPNDTSNLSPPQLDCPPPFCPEDCEADLFIDPQNGCMVCRCDPNDTSNLSPPQPGLFCHPAVCPMDCGVEFYIDPQNGCKSCRCDPNDTSNPFAPPPPSITDCPPTQCPADCTTVTVIDPDTGCESCLCDHPFVPKPRVRACPPTQCPAGCKTETIRDPDTGCETCQCSPSDSVSNARHDMEDLTDKVNKDLMSFEEYLLKFDKQYPDEAEYLKRKAIFEESVRMIKEHNQKWYSGKSTFKLGINGFSDMELSEVPMGLDLSLDRDRFP